MNILIKLMSIVALIMAPHISESEIHGKAQSTQDTIEQKIDESNGQGQINAESMDDQNNIEKTVQYMMQPDGNARVITTVAEMKDGRPVSFTTTEVRALSEDEKLQLAPNAE